MSANQSPRTNEQYVKNNGSQCPVCGSEDVEGHAFDVQGPRATQERTCLECGAGWDDVYQLTGYNNLEQG